MKFLTILLIFTGNIQTMAQELIVEENVEFLALGDSYTIGESVPINERWPEQLNDSLRRRGLNCFDPRIIATTGWRTDNLKNAITSTNLKPEYSLVSLLIGVNDYYQGKSVESYGAEFEELLTMAINLAGGVKSHVFVVSIPDYGYTPFGKPNQLTISQGIDAFNSMNETITRKLGVKYFYITDISRRGLDESDLVASDGLHPSGTMYTEWVDLIIGGAEIKQKEVSTDYELANRSYTRSAT